MTESSWSFDVCTDCLIPLAKYLTELSDRIVNPGDVSQFLRVLDDQREAEKNDDSQEITRCDNLMESIEYPPIFNEFIDVLADVRYVEAHDWMELNKPKKVVKHLISVITELYDEFNKVAEAASYHYAKVLEEPTDTWFPYAVHRILSDHDGLISNSLHLSTEQVEVIEEAYMHIGIISANTATRLLILADSLGVKKKRSNSVTPRREKQVVTSKRSTVKGEARAKIVAALLTHHEWKSGHPGKTTPVGNNELAELAGVDKGTVSRFFDREFGDFNNKNGYSKYRIHCQHKDGLINCLKILSGDIRPSILDKQLPEERRRFSDDG